MLLVTYADETASTGQRVAAIVGGSFGSIALAIALILAYAGIRWAYSRRRRPWAWVAVRVLNAASRESTTPVEALGIGSSNGSLVIRLPQGITNNIEEGDTFSAFNSHTRKILGLVSVVDVHDDSCICVVLDKMDHEEFWTELESRMNHDFSAPAGVEFAFPANQDSFDIVRRQIRNWAG